MSEKRTSCAVLANGGAGSLIAKEAVIPIGGLAHRRIYAIPASANPTRTAASSGAKAILRAVEIQDFHLGLGCDSSFGWIDSY